jgi:hypothetical protein
LCKSIIPAEHLEYHQITQFARIARVRQTILRRPSTVS